MVTVIRILAGGEVAWQSFLLAEKGISMENANNLLTPLATQVANVRAWNEKYGWGFSEGEIADLNLGHNEPQQLRRAKVVTASLASPSLTFDAWWRVIADIYENTRRFDEIQTDVEHLRLADQATFVPNHLSVVTLDMGATQRPAERGNGSEGLTNFEILAAIAHFSAWVRTSRPWSFYMGGFRVRNPEIGITAWDLVPSVHWAPVMPATPGAPPLGEHSLVLSAGREGDPVPTAKWPARL
ncbi:hypothetical protein LE181_25600 [Streptomyces sp. SCA3-4]|uniref:hypothetical protein n=1 Tax=Streptomyces sichuanensis TaxID=2871810 RepID=UPI001CE3A9B8|nr:hypothetical protein [Streptomyces sichuanensis]MCA6095527.1 hypothetical protein [Streptomyces sichuanensis]